MRKLPIALGLYSVRGTLFSDLAGTLAKVRDMGYDGVEFYGPFSVLPAHLVQALRDADLRIAGWHVPVESLEGINFGPTVAYLQAVGVEAAIVPFFAADAGDEWRAFARRMNAIAQNLKAKGMRLGYHNHAHEFSKTEGGKTMWQIFCEALSPDVFPQLDTGNGLKGGMNPIEELTGRTGIFSTHFKPWKKDAPAGGSDVMFDRDDQDLQAMVTLSEAAGAQWHIIEFETENTYSQMGGAREALRTFKKVVG